MKKILFLIIIMFTVFALNARAQFMEGKYDDAVKDVDAIAQKHNQLYINERFAGENENKKPQAQRYKEMLRSVNRAIDHHYDRQLITDEGPAVKRQKAEENARSKAKAKAKARYQEKMKAKSEADTVK